MSSNSTPQLKCAQLMACDLNAFELISVALVPIVCPTMAEFTVKQTELDGYLR